MEKELIIEQKELARCKEEVIELKAQSEKKESYERMCELQIKLKNSELNIQTLKKEINDMQQIYDSKEKELEELINTEDNSKLRQLNEEFKKIRTKNKEIEKQIQTANEEYKNEHNCYLKLQERLQKLKQKEITWKKAIAENKLPTDELNNEADKIKILDLQKKVMKQKIIGKKTIDELNVQIANYLSKIKEEEEKYKQSSERLALLRNMIKHNKLQPINSNEIQAKLE